MKKSSTLIGCFIGYSLAIALLFTASVYGQYTTNWVAINDHHRGPTSSPYANFYNPLGDDAGLSGPLTNTVNYAVLPQGAPTPASIQITITGNYSAFGTMGAPNAGTPAANWFGAYVDFGSGNRDAIGIRDDVLVTYTFTGLDPSKRYVFKATAVRGGNYMDRWTVATIEGVNSFTHAHRPTWEEALPNYGVITAAEVGTLNPNQAAWNAGENRAAGAMIVFSDIDPGPDGSFTVTARIYRGEVPNGQSTTSPQYSYAFSAFSLEELTVIQNEPIVVVSAPTNQTILEGQTLTLSVGVTGSNPQYQWYKNGSPIPDATNRFYQVRPALPSHSGSYYVSVWNNVNSTNTPPVDIVVISEPIVITNALRDLDVFEASTVTLTVGVSGTFPHYQWYKDGVPIEGATNVSITITNFSPQDAGTYSVVVTNSTSQASSQGKLTYIADTIPPRIIAAVASTNYLTIDLVFSEPVSDEAADPFNYQLYPAVGDPIFPQSSVKTSPTNATLTFLAGDIQFGNRYSVVASGIFDLSRQSNPIDSAPKAVAMYYVPLLSIDERTMWRFDSRGIDWSNVWYKVDFDDSGWSNGAALFEAKIGTIPALPEPVRTVMNNSNMQATARVATYYFRTWFEFTGNDPTNSAAVIRTIIDDGAVFYLNGREIYRLGMPSGEITYNTLANRTVGDATYEGPFTIYLPGLVAGSNLVAVEVHQASLTSSDATMGLQVIGIMPALTPVEIVNPLVDTTINERESIVLSVSVRGASPSYQWYKNDVPIPGATSSFLPISNAKPSDSGIYKVVVSNMVNTVESSALVTVIPDTTPPAVISAVASTNLTTITITFSEPLDPFSSQDPGNYVITPAGGGAAIDIMNIILQNSTNVVITTTPMEQGVIYSIRINGVSDTSEAANTLINYTQNILATTVIMPVWVDWKYENTGTDLGTNWFETGYNDSAWLSGGALFGLETGGFVDANPINTPFALTNASGTFIPTFYFRKWFTFPYKTEGVKIAFMHAVDDGAVFYINGVEVYRYNMPAGEVNFNTLSSTSVDVSDYTVSPFITITNLVSGPNLLAVEVHQGSLTSSDVLFGAGILAQLPSFEIVYTETPRLEYSVDGKTIRFTWSAPGFRLQQNSDLNTTNWTNVPDGNQSPVVVPILEGNMFFRLVK